MAFCKSVGGLKVERETLPYKEGGQNTFTHKLVGPATHQNIVLKRGFVSPSSQVSHKGFAKEFFDQLLSDKVKRFEGTVSQLGPDLKVVCSWKIHRGWICKWDGPDLDASKSELSFETIEIAHHGLEFVAG